MNLATRAAIILVLCGSLLCSFCFANPPAAPHSYAGETLSSSKPENPDSAITGPLAAEQRDIEPQGLVRREANDSNGPVIWLWVGNLAGSLVLILCVSLYWQRRLAREVAERRNAEAGRQKSEERFRSLIEGVGTDYALYVQDLDGKLSYVSPSAEKFYGIPPEDMIGRQWQDLLPDEDSQELVQNSIACIQRGETPPACEIGYLHPDGNLRHWTICLQPTCDDSGALCAVEAIIKDRTAAKHAEQALTEALEAAEQANRAKSSFLSHLAHELRAPLTAILGYAQLLQRNKDLPESAKVKIDSISHSGQQLSELIKDVLEVSRLEAGHLELKPMLFDLQDLLDNLAAKFRPAAERKGLNLEFAGAGKLPHELICDQEKLRQILINLISNAIKFTPRGSIIVDAELIQKNGAMLILRVKDSGPGIAPDEMNRLFRPFGQSRSDHDKDGTGLGLIISREYARQMGGDLMVSSEPGRGSTFTLSCRVFENQASA